MRGAGEHADAAVVVLATGRFEVLCQLAEGQRERGQPDLDAVVQVTLDTPQLGSRLIDRAGTLLLQYPAALGGGRDPRLRVPLGLQPSCPVLKRGEVGNPVPVGDRIAQHPRGQDDCAQPGSGGEQRDLRMRGVHWRPAGDGDGRQDQADDQARERDPPRPLVGC